AGDLVVHVHVWLGAEFARAVGRHQAVAGGDEGHGDAGLAQLDQPLAVEHVEGLGLAAVLVEPPPPVGERAVHVEAGQPDAGGAFDESGRIFGAVVGHVLPRMTGRKLDRRQGATFTGREPRSCDHTTRARSRSCTFSAPTTRRCASTTSNALILRVSIRRAASTASASLSMVTGSRVITSAMAVACTSTLRSASVRRRSPSV